MEKRNVKISLEQAKEWYTSGDSTLKELALSAFTKEELCQKPWEKIKTFQDACNALGLDASLVKNDLFVLSPLYNSKMLIAQYKLCIIKNALNDSYSFALNSGTIYYPRLRYYPEDYEYPTKYTKIGDFRNRGNGKIYTLVGGACGFCDGGLSYFGYGYGVVDAGRGLLGCKSEEIAKYMSITFGKIIFDAIYGQYINYKWV